MGPVRMNKNAAYHPKITVQPNWTPEKEGKKLNQAQKVQQTGVNN